MKKLFIDTNVMIDLIGHRNPFYSEIAKIASLAEEQKIQLIASSLSFVNTYYIISKNNEPKLVIDSLKKFRLICGVSAVDELTIDKSLVSNFNDFEDGVQNYSALHSNCDIIITRNEKDFKKAQIPVMSPTEFLASINKN